jgi:hypothetical protein
MRALLPPAAVLAALAATASPAGREPRIEAFPGPIQPDPGTRIGASRNGRAVAFEASFRDAGERYDPAATPTVFVWERGPGTLRQATASGPSDQPAAENGTFYLPVGTSISKQTLARTLVAFRSTANLAGRNADLSPEIFVWDSKNGAITQVTDALAGASSDPAIGARFTAERGTTGLHTGNVLVRYRVAFLSTSDLTGDNPGGLVQVFLYDSGLPEVGRLVQISHSTSGAAGRPAMDRNGQRIAFTHDGDVVPGDAPPAGRSVYLYDPRAGTTRMPLEGDGEDGDPAVDTSGRYAAWASTRYAEAGNDPLSRSVIIHADLRTGRAGSSFFTALGDCHSPSLGRGPRIAFLGPGFDPPEAEERPLLWNDSGWPREIGIRGPGTFGAPALTSNRRRLFLTSTADPDGSNVAGRNVLWIVDFAR